MPPHETGDGITPMRMHTETATTAIRNRTKITDIGGFVHDVEAAKEHQQAHHHFGRIQHAFEPQLREAKIQ